MKSIKNLFLALLFVPSFVGAQDSTQTSSSSEFQTIGSSSDKDKKTKISGFGTVSMDFGQFNNKFGMNFGLEGAMLINHGFYIGLYTKGMTSLQVHEFQMFESGLGANINISAIATFFQGGLVVGYEFLATKPFHFGISTKIGGGGLGLFYEAVTYTGYYDYGFKHLLSVFVINPQADFIMNITNWFKIRVGIGYQWVSDGAVHYNELNNGNVEAVELFNASKLRSVVGTVGFSFGGFK